jgi:hypothetical protein
LFADIALKSGFSFYDPIKTASLLEKDIHWEDLVRPKLLLVLVNYPEEATSDFQGFCQLHLVMKGHVLIIFFLSFHQLGPINLETAGEIRKVLQ